MRWVGGIENIGAKSLTGGRPDKILFAMKRLGGIVWVLLLAAMAVCAIVPAGASAVTIHACEEGPVKGETAQEYTSSTCETKGVGKFRTVPIATGTLVTPTNITPTSQNIFGTIAGVSVEIECKGMSGSGKGENEVVGGVTFGRIKGLKIKYFECTVLLPKGGGCILKKVEPTIETESLFVFTKEESKEVVIEMYKEGGAGVIASFTIEGCKNNALNGLHKLTGIIKGTVAADHTTINFNTASGLELDGVAASYIGNVRFFMEGTEKRLAFVP